MSDGQEFKEALREKKIPILVLDQKWHRLFAIHGKPDHIKKLESELNLLLGRQGKLNNEIKDLKKAKNQLMDHIVQNMDAAAENAEEKVRKKKLEEDRRLIDELNEQIDADEEELLRIPDQIRNTNESLMIRSMEYFYEKLRVNKEESEEIDAWIKQVRIDLKKNIIRKQNRDINNREIYAYLHDIFGREVVDLFDIRYDELQENLQGEK